MGIGAESGLAEPILTIQNLGKVYSNGRIRKGDVVALGDFSLRIAAERGGGKTTTAPILLGLLTPTCG